MTASLAANTEFYFGSSPGGPMRPNDSPLTTTDGVLLVLAFLFKEFFELFQVFFVANVFDKLLVRQARTAGIMYIPSCSKVVITLPGTSPVPASASVSVPSLFVVLVTKVAVVIPALITFDWYDSHSRQTSFKSY